MKSSVFEILNKRNLLKKNGHNSINNPTYPEILDFFFSIPSCKNYY